MEELELTGLSREEILYEDANVLIYYKNLERNSIRLRPIFLIYKEKLFGKRNFY